MVAQNREDAERGEKAKDKKFYEFDCPLCNANNPYGDGFVAKEEIRCYYCGQAYKVRVDDEGRMKLKEV